MNLKEIYDQKWEVSEVLKVIHNDLTGLTIEEQETHFNIERDIKTVFVDCSDQTKITELSKSEYFFLERVLVSSNPRYKDYILAITGHLPEKAITIRKKIPVVTEETRELRRAMAKKNFSK